MQGNTTIIADPEGRAAEKKFTFDYSYWSHDGFREREDGYLEPVEERYADQVCYILFFIFYKQTNGLVMNIIFGVACLIELIKVL